MAKVKTKYLNTYEEIQNKITRILSKKGRYYSHKVLKVPILIGSRAAYYYSPNFRNNDPQLYPKSQQEKEALTLKIDWDVIFPISEVMGYINLIRNEIGSMS